MKSYNIAVIPGDGIGHKIVPAGIHIVESVASKCGFEVQQTIFNYGAEHFAGQGIANPIVQISSASIILDHLGETDAVNDIIKAINAVRKSEITVQS